MRQIQQLNRAQTFAALAARGADDAVLDFAGGHDEGGVERIALRAAGLEIAELDASPFTDTYARDEAGALVYEQATVHSPPPESRPTTVLRPKLRPKTDNEMAETALATALSEPVYARFGGFDGTAEISGTLTWNVASGRVTMYGHPLEDLPDPGGEEV